MPLGMEVGLGPGHVVLDGDRSPRHRKGHSPRHFAAHVYCGQAAGWIKMPFGTQKTSAQATLCYMGTQLPFPKKGTDPNFRPMSIVAKRSPISAAAEHLFQ